MPKTLTRAAGYVRRSDPREKGFSYEFQRDKIIEYCMAQHIPIKEEHIFYDKYTGRVWRERKGLQALIAAAKRREFDIVVMYKLDRFSRDHIDQIVVREQLKYYGVTIVTLDPDEHADDDSIAGQIIRMVFAFMAEIERKNILERCNDGRQARVKDGSILPSSRPLYGYLWVDKEVTRDGETFTVKKAYYVLDPVTSKIVLRIFTLYDSGIPLRHIANILTREGIPTPTGGKIWMRQSVRYILTHPFYAGQAHMFKNKQEFIPGEGVKRSIRPKTEWVALPDSTVPAIVSQEVFDRCQKRLVQNKQNASRNNANPEETLCRAGYAKCGYCHSTMIVTRDPQYGPFYRCQKVAQSYKGMRECENGTIMAKFVDREVWEKAVEIIRDPQQLDAELAKWKQEDPTKDERDTITKLVEDVVPNTTVPLVLE